MMRARSDDSHEGPHPLVVVEFAESESRRGRPLAVMTCKLNVRKTSFTEHATDLDRNEVNELSRRLREADHLLRCLPCVECGRRGDL